MCFHFRQALFRCAVLGICWVPVQAASAEPPSASAPEILTNVAQVRALKPEAASKQLPIRIRGVVVVHPVGAHPFVVLDETAGLYVDRDAIPGLIIQRGDLIEVEGVSNPGKYAPYLVAKAIRKLGTGKVPDPQVADQEAVFSGRLDAQWIEVSGIIRRAEPLEGGLALEVSLKSGGKRIQVLADGQGRSVSVDSTVRLRGICYYKFNDMGQAIRPFLFISPDEPIVQESAATPADDLPVRPVGTLLQFDPDRTDVHRVHVRGVVFHTRPSEGFWIRDGGHGLTVACMEKELPANGSEVDVFGFVKRGEYGPMIEDAVFRNTGKTMSVPPVHLGQAAEALANDSNLVTCDAVVREKWLAADGCRLKLSDQSIEFPAVIHSTNQMAMSEEWIPGTRVRVTGVCSVGILAEPFRSGTLSPESFQLLLRSGADIQVLQRPSWWTAEHIAWLLGSAAAALLLAVGIIVWIGRRHLREQAIERMKTEAEFSAVMNERSRMAREFHDTIAQGLGAISLQLEVAKRQIPADSNAQEPLGEASLQTRASLDEVRNTIWNMRSQVLESGDLASALNGVLHSLTDRNHIQSELRVVGEPRRFAPVVENNLLRIGQEAIANAVKHAQAKQIEVVLKFAGRQFELSVSDDGRGFDTSHPPAGEGGFGLVGLRERAAELHGELDVSSFPGKGCVVRFTLPLVTS
jgi:signal transduction histidine kinase